MAIKDKKVADKPPIETLIRRDDDPIQTPRVQPHIEVTVGDQGQLDHPYNPTHVDSTPPTRPRLAILESPITREVPVPAFYKVQETVQMPSNIFIEKDELDPSIKIIRRKWDGSYGELCCAIVWNAFVWTFNIFFIVNGIWEGLLFVFLLPTVLGIWTACSFLGQMMNSTYITMDGMNIHVDHRSICTCFKTIIFPLNQIGEVCCKKCVHRTICGGAVVSDFQVHVISNDMSRGRTVLVSDLKTLKEALFIAQEIENFSPPMLPSRQA